jgi:hypothetical protein
VQLRCSDFLQEVEELRIVVVRIVVDHPLVLGPSHLEDVQEDIQQQLY